MSIKKGEYAPPTRETVEPSTGNCLAEIGHPAAIHRDDACKAWGLWSNSRVHTIRAYSEISRMWLKMVQEKAHRPNWIRRAFWFSRVEWWNIRVTPSVLGRETWGESDTNQPCSPLCSAVRCDCGCQLQPPDFKTQPTVFTPHAGWISNSAECWVTANPTLTINAKQRETSRHHGPDPPRFSHTHASPFTGDLELDTDTLRCTAWRFPLMDWSVQALMWKHFFKQSVIYSDFCTWIYWVCEQT